MQQKAFQKEVYTLKITFPGRVKIWILNKWLINSAFNLPNTVININPEINLDSLKLKPNNLP